MAFEHACFLSFPQGGGADAKFADHFFDVLQEQLWAYDKRLSVFKFDRCERRRRGDAWTLWIQRELCDSAMMIAVCAPGYFNGSPGCVSEFQAMEELIKRRLGIVGPSPNNDWLVGLRLKDKVSMPALDPYPVTDFFDCCASPDRVRKVRRHRETVETLADRVYGHWCWLHAAGRHEQLEAADVCVGFQLPDAPLHAADKFPRTGAVR
jgi:hypothetical protein